MFKFHQKIDYIFLLVFSLILLTLRVPLVNKFLYEWDSASYVLALGNYNIFHEQPQAPGYILYIALGRIVNFIFQDGNTTFLFLGIVFSILTVFVVYFLAKNLFNREVAVVSAVLLIFNPLFWFYGEIGSIYIFQAFFSVLIAFLCYKALKENGIYVYISALVLGISGGFRLDMVMLLFPLWLFCMLHNRTTLKKMLKGLSILVVGVLLWLIPTLVSVGGLENYLELLSTVSSAGYTSLLMGASLSSQIINSGLSIVWYLLALNLFGIIIMVIFLILQRGNWKRKLGVCLENTKSRFFILWILPAFLFFTVIYIIKPGYALISLPALVIILGYVLKGLAEYMHVKIPKTSVSSFIMVILAIGVIVNAVVYLYPYDLHQNVLWETPHGNLTESQKAIFDINVGLMYNQQKIKENDVNTMFHIETVNNLSNNDPNSSVIVIRDITREDEGFNWRKAMYYLPDYKVYYLFDSENSHLTSGVSAWLGQNHTDQKTESSTVEINLDPSVTKIIWVMNNQTNFYREVASYGNLHSITLPNGLEIYYTDVGSGSVNLKVSGFLFKR